MPLHLNGQKIGNYLYLGSTRIREAWLDGNRVYRRSRSVHVSKTLTANGSLIIPETLTSNVGIVAVGGGGSGGSGFYFSKGYGGGGGGGSAGYAYSVFAKAALSGKTITFTVGQGGAPVTTGPNSYIKGNDGGTTTVTIPGQTTMYGYGGAGGATFTIDGGGGGSASGGNQSNVSGNAGVGGAFGGSGAGGAGGASVWNGYGAGGAGASTPGMGTSSSGPGVVGCVHIEYDYIEYF